MQVFVQEHNMINIQSQISFYNQANESSHEIEAI